MKKAKRGLGCSAKPDHGTVELADRLHSLAIHLLRRLRRVDDATGLSAPRLSALSVVVHTGPLSVGDLAGAEQVRPPTMTRVVAALEAQKLVKRTTDQDDRRVIRIEATGKGKRLLQQGRGRRVAMLAEWLDALNNGDVRTVDRAVARLEQLLQDQDQ